MRYAWIVPVLLLTGCASAPDDGSTPVAASSSTSWLLPLARTQRSTAIQYADTPNDQFPIKLRVPESAKKQSISAIYYFEVDDKLLFRVFFTEDVGWKKALPACGALAKSVEEHDVTSVQVNGVATQRTKLRGLQRPFMYYGFYHVAPVAPKDHPERYWLDLELQ